MLTSCSRFLQQRNVDNWGVLTFPPLTASTQQDQARLFHCSIVLGGQELKPRLSLWAEESESRGLGSSSLHPSPVCSLGPPVVVLTHGAGAVGSAPMAQRPLSSSLETAAACSIVFRFATLWTYLAFDFPLVCDLVPPCVIDTCNLINN